MRAAGRRRVPEAAGPLRHGTGRHGAAGEGPGRGAPQAGEREGAAGLPSAGGGSGLPDMALPWEVNSNSHIDGFLKFVGFWGEKYCTAKVKVLLALPAPLPKIPVCL